jgi:hypothetical protein
MIKKTFLTAIALFILYSVFVIFFAPEWWRASQHQWQINVTKAQNFLYDDSDTFQNVIVGSSLSCRLITDDLPNTYNLSFSGLSIFDGLYILTHKSKLPKNIFIEMNVVLHPETKEFTESLTSPVLYYPRKIIPSLREDKQPIAVLGNILGRNLERVLPPPILSESETSDGTSLFSKMLNLYIKGYSQEPSKESLDKSFNTLKKYITKIESNDVNIIFFEIPVNKQLENLPRAKIIRETFYKYFPKFKYKYTSLPDAFECETTDGIHLNGDEALKYTNYFVTENINYFRTSWGKNAETNAEKWLTLVDTGKYSESWQEAAENFRSTVKQDQFGQMLQSVRKPLGKVISRKVISRKLKTKAYGTALPGAPDSQYVMIEFETSFQNKKSVMETVISMFDKNGLWRVAVYQLK